LLQKDAKPRQQILDLLGKVEKESDLKLGAEEMLMTLEKRVSLNVAMVTRLHKEQYELLQTIWGGSARSVVRPVRSMTRLSRSAMRRSRGSAPSRPSSEPLQPRC